MHAQKAWADKNPERHREINRLATRRFYRKHPDAAKKETVKPKGKARWINGKCFCWHRGISGKSNVACVLLCCRAKLLGSTPI